MERKYEKERNERRKEWELGIDGEGGRETDRWIDIQKVYLE